MGIVLLGSVRVRHELSTNRENQFPPVSKTLCLATRRGWTSAVAVNELASGNLKPLVGTGSCYIETSLPSPGLIFRSPQA